MAHFAQIDESGVVTRVIVVNNSDIMDANGVESEEIGVRFCSNLLGGRWVQTSYNANFRKNYAGVGYIYDSARDAFIPPSPYPSWILDEVTCNWTAPIPKPDGEWEWDEESTTWKEVANDPS